MGTPQEIQKPVAPEISDAKDAMESADAESQGHAELAQRFEALVNRMSDIYKARLEQNIMSRDALQALSVSPGTPDWKKKAAQKALGSTEAGK